VARGWESKHIEAQQEEAQRTKATGDERSPGAPEVQARRRTLELARTRARADLASARAPAHRDMLEQALKALDEQLAKLGP